MWVKMYKVYIIFPVWIDKSLISQGTEQKSNEAKG